MASGTPTDVQYKMSSGPLLMYSIRWPLVPPANVQYNVTPGIPADDQYEKTSHPLTDVQYEVTSSPHSGVKYKVTSVPPFDVQ